MQCARCFLVLGSLRQAATTGRVPECAVLVPTLHGHDVIQQDNFSSHWCNWESCIERTDWEDDQECVLKGGGARKEELRTFWKIAHIDDEHAGRPVLRKEEELRAPLPPEPPSPAPMPQSFLQPSSSPPLPPLQLLLYLLVALLTVVLAGADAVAHDPFDLSVFDEPAKEANDEACEAPPPGAGNMDVDGDTELLYEPVSRRVGIALGAHDPNRRADLDGIAAKTTASVLLDHARSATRSVSHGGGQSIALPSKVYLARQWERGNERVWHRLQPHMESDSWILCTDPLSFMLFIRRSACPALMHQLPELGEFVGPALGKQAGRVVFAKRARGPITLATLLAALQKAADAAMDEQLEEVVYGSFSDRLPLANYPLNEDGWCPEAPLGHTGARLLDFFTQHPGLSTFLFFADVAVHQPLNSDPTTADTVWSLFSKRSSEERRVRRAVVDLGAHEMDQYDQFGMAGGWMKFKIGPNRRRVLAEDAIDAHTVPARTVLRDSRLSGSGVYWEAPVR